MMCNSALSYNPSLVWTPKDLNSDQTFISKAQWMPLKNGLHLGDSFKEAMKIRTILLFWS